MKKFAPLLAWLPTVFFALVMIVSVHNASAQTASGTQTWTGASFDFHIDNPVTAFDNLPDLIVALLNIVMLIMTPIVAVMIIYTGYKFVSSRGDPQGVGEAKQMLLAVVIGAAIILGAKIIATAIQGTVNSLT